ncbi:MAG: hypothetical protein LBP79_04265 [Clostridiales bacterium]|jgi:hypothetical protein|nr:hypothetical protein [Clostridiales bacterium]
MEWFNGLQAAEQILFVIAVIASAFLVVQFALLLIGMSNGSDAFDGGSDAHFDGDACADGTDAGYDGIGDIQSNSTSVVEASGLKVLTIRGAVAFLAVGGWTAFGLFGAVSYWSLLIGAAAGALTALLLAVLMRAILRLEGRGNISFNRAVGATGVVYLSIPQKRTGAGKITVMIQERLVECSAMTDAEEKIEDGAIIKIVALADTNTFLVERI